MATMLGGRRDCYYNLPRAEVDNISVIVVLFSSLLNPIGVYLELAGNPLLPQGRVSEERKNVPISWSSTNTISGAFAWSPGPSQDMPKEHLRRAAS